MKSFKLFYCYSHFDEVYRKELERWLSTLKQEGHISEWYDRMLLAGDSLENKLKINLHNADIILLLLTQNFISSKACQEEMCYALSQYDQKRIIPIILKPCTWKDTGCSTLVALPTDGKALDCWDSTETAWLDIFTGIKKIIAELRETFEIRKEFLKEIEQIEFVRQTKAYIKLTDLFIFPLLTEDKSDISREIIGEEAFLSGKMKSVIFKGNELSGKTSLLRWFYLHLRNGNLPIYIDGSGIYKTLNFDELFYKEFTKQLTGDYDMWKLKKNKAVLIDDFHHKISMNIISYLHANFERIYITMDEVEHMVYFKDKPAFVDFKIITIRQLPLSKQEQLIRKWLLLKDVTAYPETIDELIIDKLEEKINGIITSNHIVPRYPFYILSILQSLEIFMPRDLGITAYGHCYHALVTAQLIKKNIGYEEIDSCFNYLSELSFDIYKKIKIPIEYTTDDYTAFKKAYKIKYLILDSVINRIERDEYPIIRIKDNIVQFEYSYIFYFFIGRYLASNIDQSMINELCNNIYLKINAYIIIFTIHHATNKDLLDTILSHCICSFDKTTPAELSTNETCFMNALMLELPKSIISGKSIQDNRSEQRVIQDEREHEKEDATDIVENITLREISKGMKMIEILGQILKNRAGSYDKRSVLEILENTIELGLRILNLLLSDCRKPDFKIWLTRMLEENENNLSQSQKINFNDNNRIHFIEKMIQFFGYLISITMINKVAYSIGSEKLLAAIYILTENKKTPAYKLIEFLVNLMQKGVDIESLILLVNEFENSKNFWAQKTLSFYVQNYINTHNINYKERQKILNTLGLKYTPNPK